MAQTSTKQIKYPPLEIDPLEMLSQNQHKIGHAVEEVLDAAGNAITSETKKKKIGPLLSNFETGNQIQLVSKTSGRSLRIAEARSGKLVADGRGDIGEQAWNAVWTVINEGHNQVRLHNHNNFLAIVNGQTIVIHVPQGSEHDKLETLLLLVLDPENFVALESVREPEKCVGIEENGSLKSAENCYSSDDHAMFGVHLIKTK
ncbi:uncharacterized protein [Magallana gigas]